MQRRNGKDGRLARPRLRLRNDVATHANRTNGPLLDGRRLLKAVRINAFEQVRLEVHGIECGTRRGVILGASTAASGGSITGSLTARGSVTRVLRIARGVVCLVALSRMIALVVSQAIVLVQILIVVVGLLLALRAHFLFRYFGHDSIQG